MVKYSSLGGMAQLVEHSLHMRGVTGSSPVVSTIHEKSELIPIGNRFGFFVAGCCARSLLPRGNPWPAGDPFGGGGCLPHLPISKDAR